MERAWKRSVKERILSIHLKKLKISKLQRIQSSRRPTASNSFFVFGRGVTYK